MWVTGWLNQPQFVMAWLFYVTPQYLEGHGDGETLTHKKTEAINATISVIGLWSQELGNNSLVLQLKGTWRGIHTDKLHIAEMVQEGRGWGGQKWGEQGLFHNGMGCRGRAHVSCCVYVCVCVCVCVCVNACSRVTLGDLCASSVSLSKLWHSAPKHSPHITWQKSRCHLTKDQNSVSVTHTLGTDSLCGLLMISEHIAGLFCKSDVRQPST